MVIRGNPTKQTLQHIYKTILETIKNENCYEKPKEKENKNL